MSKAPSHNVIIFKYLASRAIEVSREEIAQGTGLNRERVREGMRRLVAIGAVEVRTNSQGVTYYKAHPDAHITKHNHVDAVRLKVGAAVETPRDIEKKQQPLKESDIDRLGEEGKDFIYQQGYVKGYNDGLFHSHRDAYQAGKKVVIEGLLKLLKLDAKVLMS